MSTSLLYWFGCTTRYLTPELSSAMINILKKSNIEYVTLGDDEVCCGYPLLLTGDTTAFTEVASKVVELIKRFRSNTILTNCPGCYRCFLEFYPKFVGELPFKVVHSTQLLKDLITSGRLKVHKEFNVRVTYHDPCDLGRHMGIYNVPRQVITSIPGIKLVEMERSKDAARCCGSGGALRILIPQLSNQIASTRIKDDVTPLDVDAIITACPTCVKGLKDGASIAEITYGVKHVDVFDVVQLVDMVTGV